MMKVILGGHWARRVRDVPGGGDGTGQPVGGRVVVQSASVHDDGGAAGRRYGRPWSLERTR